MTDSDFDSARENKVRRLLLKGAFAIPVVATYAMSALTIDKAAAASNSTSSRLSE